MNMTSYLTEKDWEEITKRIEACVERVLERNNLTSRTCLNDNGETHCVLPKLHEEPHKDRNGLTWKTGFKF